MQTELRLRLLRKDETSPSGYRIVGHQRNINGKIEQTHEIDKKRTHFRWGWPLLSSVAICSTKALAMGWVDHDAFDLGVKVDDEWLYEGDIVTANGVTGPLERKSNGQMALKDACWEYQPYHCTYTGRTIHDEE